MSRIGKKPVTLPKGVEVQVNGNTVEVKGSKGKLTLQLHSYVSVRLENGELCVAPKQESHTAWAICGTMRALLNNMVNGVNHGFQKKLIINGVGYRAQTQGHKLTLNLGYSNPIEYLVPEGITIEAPSPTELLIKGIDKQQVGEVAAKIRAFRPPEPYKGKGVRYEDEHILLKEGKKK